MENVSIAFPGARKKIAWLFLLIADYHSYEGQHLFQNILSQLDVKIYTLGELSPPLSIEEL